MRTSGAQFTEGTTRDSEPRRSWEEIITPEFLKSGMDSLKIGVRELGRRSGVDYRTLDAIAKGRRPAPVGTGQKLYATIVGDPRDFELTQVLAMGMTPEWITRAAKMGFTLADIIKYGGSQKKKTLGF